MKKMNKNKQKLKRRVIIQMGVHPHLVNTLDYPHLVQMELVQVGLVQMTHG